MTIYQITAKVRYGGVMEMRNIHHYEFPGYTPSQTELQEAVDAVDAAYKSNLQAQLVNDVLFYGYDVRRVDIGSQPTAEFNATAGDWVGSSAVDPLPPQICAMVTWKAFTAFPRTCRVYLFPFNEGSSDNLGQVASGTFDLINDFASDMITLTITGQTDASKVTVQYGGTPRAVTDSNSVTTVSVTDIWRTQRRRTYGVGI